MRTELERFTGAAVEQREALERRAAAQAGNWFRPNSGTA